MMDSRKDVLSIEMLEAIIVYLSLKAKLM